MFDQKTLFIIGAGAGVEIEMPMGNKLSTSIATKTNIKYNMNQLESGDYQIANALKRFAAAQGANFNAWRAQACGIAEGIHHSRSIDAYLSTHKDNEAVKVAAKLAIVQSILEAENECHIQRSHGHWRDNDKVGQSWFPDLFYLMQDGVGRSDDIRGIFKNVAFINFNYDRCLEHYLYYAIQELYHTDERETAEIMEAIEIHRPYGQVGYLDWQRKGTRVGVGAKGYGDLDGLSQEIKTFNEQISDEVLLKGIHDAINNAGRIVFLGFHFHKQNMDLLTVTNGSTQAGPSAFATTIHRSGPETTMIKGRISKITGGNRPFKSIEPLGLGCKDLFRNYGTTWM